MAENKPNGDRQIAPISEALRKCAGIAMQGQVEDLLFAVSKLPDGERNSAHALSFLLIGYRQQLASYAGKSSLRMHRDGREQIRTSLRTDIAQLEKMKKGKLKLTVTQFLLNKKVMSPDPLLDKIPNA